MNRYEWEDALVDAQTTGLISNGALLLALKLARAINWSPKDKRPAGLYWKNEEALRSVGASRTTYFDHRQSLFDSGFFQDEGGNLIPRIPESVVRTEEESQIEDDTPEKSVVRTTESVVRTEKSVVRNPLSEDTLSEDVLSEEEDTTAPGGPVDGTVREEATIVDLPLTTTEDKPWVYKGVHYLNSRQAQDARRADELAELWKEEA